MSEKNKKMKEETKLKKGEIKWDAFLKKAKQFVSNHNFYMYVNKKWSKTAINYFTFGTDKKTLFLLV